MRLSSATKIIFMCKNGKPSKHRKTIAKHVKLSKFFRLAHIKFKLLRRDKNVLCRPS